MSDQYFSQTAARIRIVAVGAMELKFDRQLTKQNCLSSHPVSPSVCEMGNYIGRISYKELLPSLSQTENYIVAVVVARKVSSKSFE
jgi:hypothetical protein